MNSKVAIAAVILVLLTVSVYADKIVLHEGKVISGKITQENDQEVMIKVAGNMFLRIERSKIKNIERPVKSVDTRPVVTLQSVTPTPTPTPVSTASPAPVASATPVKSPVAAAMPAAAQPVPTTTPGPVITPMPNQKSEKVGNFTLNFATNETVKNTKPDDPQPACGVESSLAASWDGVAGSEEGQAIWKKSSITAAASVSYFVAGRAKEAPAELQKHAAAHVDVYHKGLLKLGSKLGNMRAANEDALRSDSERLVETELKRLKNQIAGLDRRSR